MNRLANVSSGYSESYNYKNDMPGKHEEVDISHELLAITQEKALSVEEIEFISENKKNSVKYKKKHKNNFYSFLIFSLTHELFKENESHQYWKNICGHRAHLNNVLGRDVGITVAALDYMTNIRKSISCPKIINQTKSTVLTEKAAKDALTHLYMRGVFDAALRYEFNKSLNHSESLVLALIDIDNFKSINDTYGHLVGDEVLSTVGSIINKAIRKKGIAARYGGEELAVIFSDTKIVEAHNIVERIRKKIEKHYKSSVNTTVSIGLAEMNGSVENPQDLVRLADRMLYKAKTTGKNRIE